MKTSFVALALAVCATTGSAHAAVPVSGVTQNVDAQQALQSLSGKADVAGKTRAEVRRELVRAQNDGEIAALNKLYQGS